ncbi:MAG: DUF4286 family protein [Tannerellaceae bacterium]|jgi:hypothetical protein|nr:DUF4286 family protein [Tannerellaceae bacterium]
MIVYNTTFHIEREILEEALAYLKTVYIPKVLAGGVLLQPCLRRVLHAEDGGESYAVQFYAADLDTLTGWLRGEGEPLHRALALRFGDKLTGFTTLLEETDWTE